MSMSRDLCPVGNPHNIYPLYKCQMSYCNYVSRYIHEVHDFCSVSYFSKLISLAYIFLSLHHEFFGNITILCLCLLLSMLGIPPTSIKLWEGKRTERGKLKRITSNAWSRKGRMKKNCLFFMKKLHLPITMRSLVCLLTNNFHVFISQIRFLISLQ